MFAARAPKSASTRDPFAMRGASAWLADHTPAGSLIFNADWVEFPELFYYNQRNVYVTGLDPRYLYDSQPDLWKVYDSITEGQEKHPGPIIRATLRRRIRRRQKRFDRLPERRQRQRRLRDRLQRHLRLDPPRPLGSRSTLSACVTFDLGPSTATRAVAHSLLKLPFHQILHLLRR